MPLRAAVLALLSAAAPLAAQQRPGDRLVLLVTGPSGLAIAGARGELQLEPGRLLPALRDLPPARASQRWVTGDSNDRGLLRFDGHDEAAANVAGAGLVTTSNGLGALVGRLLPGRAQRLLLQPMAAVTTATGSEPFTLHAVGWLPDGTRVPVPVQRGTEVRLPIGTYEIWASSADGWTWQRLSLASGQRCELRFDGPAQRLRAAAGAEIYAAGRFDVPLFGDGRETTLRGAALAAPLLSLRGGCVHGPEVLPGPPRQEPIDWPQVREAPATARFAAARGDGQEPPVLITLVRTDTDRWRPLWIAPWQDGLTTLANVTGDGWLLRLDAGLAPRALPWPDRELLGRGPLAPGVPLTVHARDEQGLPVVDLAVEYTPEHMDPAQVAARSDPRGAVQFGPVLGPGLLTVSDPRFLNLDVPIAQIPLDGLAVTVTAGSELRGRAVWPDGTPARGVVVTLRDPGGRLRPAARAVAAGPDGSFLFGGLPDDLDLVLFASTQRDGRTWTGRLPRARAARDAVDLVVADEDPSLAPPDRR